MKIQTTEPAVGQVWADNDKRMPSREVRIDSIADGFAHCTVIMDRGKAVDRKTRIHVSRLRPTATGYRYLRTEDSK